MKLGNIRIGLQNLNSQAGDRFLNPTGHIALHGRAWAADGKHETVARVEWSVGKRALNLGGVGLCVGCAEGHEATLNLGVPGAVLYITVPAKRGIVKALQRMAGTRSWDDVDVLRLALHDKSLWWSILHSSNEWSSKTPRWRCGSLNLFDVLAGNFETVHEQIECRDVQVPMPEGPYLWTVKLERTHVVRPRWPRRTFITFKAECKKGQQIPIPGKGENSWDCGPDAIYSLYAHDVRTVEDAVAKVVQSALNTRRRRGVSETYSTGGVNDIARKRAS